MRIFENFKAAITEIARELRKCSSEVHTDTYQNKDISEDPMMTTKELQAFSFAVIDTSDSAEMPGVTKEWCEAEFFERVSRQPWNPGNAYKYRKEVWDQFLVGDPSEVDDKIFDYTYAERMYWQIDPVIKELCEHPATRQAIIEIHDRMIDQDGMGGVKRIPCSMFYQFMIRDGKLDVIYVMRSTDFATHFQNDIWLANKLKEYIATEVGIEPGKFIMFASSLHIYKKDWNELQRY